MFTKFTELNWGSRLFCHSTLKGKVWLYYVKRQFSWLDEKGWSKLDEGRADSWRFQLLIQEDLIRNDELPGPIVSLIAMRSHGIMKPPGVKRSRDTWTSRLFTIIRQPCGTEVTISPDLSGWRYPRWWDVTGLFFSHHMMGVKGCNEPFCKLVRDDAFSPSTAEI